MTEPIACFLREVRQLPKFIEAARSDDKWLKHFEAMEVGLRTFAECDEAYVIEVFDQILAVIKRNDWPLNQKLLEIVRLAVIVRDHGRSVQ
jgi:hypothetical protein